MTFLPPNQVDKIKFHINLWDIISRERLGRWLRLIIYEWYAIIHNLLGSSQDKNKMIISQYFPSGRTFGNDHLIFVLIKFSHAHNSCIFAIKSFKDKYQNRKVVNRFYEYSLTLDLYFHEILK